MSICHCHGTNLLSQPLFRQFLVVLPLLAIQIVYVLVAVLQLLIPCQLSVILSSCQPSFVMSVSNNSSFDQSYCWKFFWGSKMRWWLLVGLFFTFLFSVHLWAYNWCCWCAWLSFQYLSVLHKSVILPAWDSAKNFNLGFTNLSFYKILC